MFNQKQLIEKGFDIAHWPTLDRYSKDSETVQILFRDMIGVVYDTSKWPMPNDTYHPDNWRHWYPEDPNLPVAAREEIEEKERNSKPCERVLKRAIH